MAEDTQEQSSQGGGRCSRQKWRDSCMGRCAHRYPRSVAVVCGIFLPLFVLIAMALLFGFILSGVESPREIESNDSELATDALQEVLTEVVENVTALSPFICLLIHLPNNTDYSGLNLTDRLNENQGYFEKLEILLQIKEEVLQALEDGKQTKDDLVLINSTEMLLSMAACGSVIEKEVEKPLGILTGLSASPALTFDWNSCTPYDYDVLIPLNSRRHAEQQRYYTEVWKADQSRLFEAHYNRYRYEQNFTDPHSRVLALDQSVRQATGESACVENSYAAAWFWFTVMTTIGYGNQTTETTGGRAMVFTLGFLCMLAFGGILATAGYITTVLTDDALVRLHLGLRTLTKPWAASIFWGVVAYSWMAIIAVCYQSWNEQRLGPEEGVSYGDSYWFAFLSTTTVGLGDFYLAPEVLEGSDLLVWPLLFLVAFVFFSAFMNKFSKFARTPFQDYNIGLADRLKRGRDMPNGDEADPSIGDTQQCTSPERGMAESGEPAEQPGGDDHVGCLRPGIVVGNDENE